MACAAIDGTRKFHRLWAGKYLAPRSQKAIRPASVRLRHRNRLQRKGCIPADESCYQIYPSRQFRAAGLLLDNDGHFHSWLPEGSEKRKANMPAINLADIPLTKRSPNIFFLLANCSSVAQSFTPAASASPKRRTQSIAADKGTVTT